MQHFQIRKVELRGMESRIVLLICSVPIVGWLIVDVIVIPNGFQELERVDPHVVFANQEIQVLQISVDVMVVKSSG